MTKSRYHKTKSTVEKLILEARDSAIQIGENSWRIPKMANVLVSFDPNKKGNINSYIRKYYESIFFISYIEKLTLQITVDSDE